MKTISKGLFWLLWLLGWVIYAKALSINPNALGLAGFFLGAITVVEFFYEMVFTRDLLVNRAQVYLYAGEGFIYATTLFTAVMMGGTIGIIGCSLRLLGIGLLIVFR